MTTKLTIGQRQSRDNAKGYISMAFVVAKNYGKYNWSKEKAVGLVIEYMDNAKTEMIELIHRKEKD